MPREPWDLPRTVHWVGGQSSAGGLDWARVPEGYITVPEEVASSLSAVILEKKTGYPDRERWQMLTPQEPLEP